MKSQIIIISIFILYLAGCSNNSTSIVTDNNVYSVKVTNDTLSISAVTTNYSNSQDIDLFFSVDTVKLNLSVAGYSSGSAMFKLLKDTTVIYSKSLDTSVQSIQQLITPRPNIARMNLSNYKGTVSILVTK